VLAAAARLVIAETDSARVLGEELAELVADVRCGVLLSGVERGL
jgi:hypothetical protein